MDGLHVLGFSPFVHSIKLYRAVSQSDIPFRDCKVPTATGDEGCGIQGPPEFSYQTMTGAGQNTWDAVSEELKSGSSLGAPRVCRSMGSRPRNPSIGNPELGLSLGERYE